MRDLNIKRMMVGIIQTQSGQIAVIGAISALMFPENGEVLVANTYKKLEVKPERIKAALER